MIPRGPLGVDNQCDKWADRKRTDRPDAGIYVLDAPFVFNF